MCEEDEETYVCPECGEESPMSEVESDFGCVKTETPTLRGTKVDYDAVGGPYCPKCGFHNAV